MDLWDLSLQATSDTEMKIRLQGVKAVMSIFQFLFKESYLILYFQMMVFIMIIQKKLIVSCILKSFIIL